MIMESTVPDKFVEIINDTADKVLNSETASVEWDWSHKLVGKVSKEVQIPVRDKTNRELLFSTMKGACVDYLKEAIKSNTAYGWKKIASDAVPTVDNIHLTHSWVVSQYAGDFNPIHFHTGDFSAAIYLKVPDNMVDDLDDHAPAKGMIEFAFGNVDNFRSDSVKFQPEVGKFLVFPAWLKHLVYPFTCEGERRMMSFNAKIVFDK